uniref:Uncharacterized protein n=1 Tax=Neobodo designis TaxID=312471 RepID=A0A7S1LTW5_NEODS|mmetsp:Transcript_28122/g.87137  ORF Transcript_28122/g.87137 Transcript_28122/m.87137 type:complete len:294 (+) Transcript_28122:234-1115(+)|eukprot:CAMPEP_0174828862 /NCGR_PEP_ID=MMETSP1114-20130205/1574_1 /TAXON_ID=312471 /ORGANISM="Neobodo designis, Strain CCAP 1951/1" /LENGTH=293 /DNA_ID=CAMNT_0016062589 /DNA_START=234 /DNA_END=1115 /DNA_ORIENTATION=+
MDPELNRADGRLFESTVKGGDHSSESLSLTLGAARAAAAAANGENGAAAGDLNRTMAKEEKERRRRAKKRRQKREQRAIAAAEAAAEANGITFTGTMKREVAKEALKALGDSNDGDEDYADDAFEADDEENYSDDFEADTGPSRRKSREERRQSRKTTSGGASKSSFEAINVGNDAGFEATIGGTRRTKAGKKGKKAAEKDSFGETYSRAGLPGRRKDVDSDDDHSLTLPASHHERRISGDDGPLPNLGGRAPSSGMPTARGHSPRSSPNTSHYQSDSNAGPLPNINPRGGRR